jgi:hypothetical protein
VPFGPKSEKAAAREGGGIVSIEFLVTSLVVVISPGTGVLFTLAAGLARGPRVLMWPRGSFAGAFAALGAKLGFADR